MTVWARAAVCTSLQGPSSGGDLRDRGHDPDSARLPLELTRRHRCDSPGQPLVPRRMPGQVGDYLDQPAVAVEVFAADRAGHELVAAQRLHDLGADVRLLGRAAHRPEPVQRLDLAFLRGRQPVDPRATACSRCAATTMVAPVAAPMT